MSVEELTTPGQLQRRAGKRAQKHLSDNLFPAVAEEANNTSDYNLKKIHWEAFKLGCHGNIGCLTPPKRHAGIGRNARDLRWRDAGTLVSAYVLDQRLAAGPEVTEK